MSNYGRKDWTLAPVTVRISGLSRDALEAGAAAGLLASRCETDVKSLTL